MKILVTGFGPFSTYPENPAKSLASSLEGDGVTALILPVSYARAKADLLNAIRLEHPRFILSFGLAASRKRIFLEQNARNRLEAPCPDNDGVIKNSGRIVEGGKETLATPFSIASLQKELQKKGFDVGLSQNAGAYICNEVYYLALAYPVPSLFVHLPLTRRRIKAREPPLGKRSWL